MDFMVLLKMDFFEKLRRLSVYVARESQEVESLCTRQRNIDKDEANSHAYLLLKSKKDEVTKLKREFYDQMASVKDDGGFLKLVELCGSLLEKQKEAVTKTEEYLKQYGYVCKYQPSQPDPDDTSKPTECAKEELSNSIESQSTETIVTDMSPTPPPPEETATNRTPKLEDFGMSNDFLDRIGNKIAKMKYGTTQCNPTTPEGQSTRSRIESDNGVPDSFRFSGGVIVTPGMMGDPISEKEKQESARLKSAFSAEKESPRSRRNIKADAIKIGDGTPQTPVFMTPGIKPLAKAKVVPTVLKMQDLGEGTPQTPVLNTPGIRPLSVKKPPLGVQYPIHYDDADDDSYGSDSPVLPILTHNIKGTSRAMPTTNTTSKTKDDSPLVPHLNTPGVKQLQGPSAPANYPRSMIDDDDSLCKTPEMPELTFKFKDLPQFGGSNLYQNDEPSFNDIPVPTSTFQTSQSAFSSVNHQQSHIASDQSHLREQQSHSVPHIPTESERKANMLSMNVTGDVRSTSSYNHDRMTEPPSVLSQQQNNISRHKSQTFPQPSTPKIMISKHVVQDVCDDDGAPRTPVLMGRYGFSAAPENKENVPTMPCFESITTTSTIGKGSKRIDSVHENEYGGIPDFITKNFTLEQTNQILSTFNQLFHNRDQGDGAYIGETDVQEIIGNKHRMFMLMMMKLGRMKETTLGHNKIYIPK